MRRWLDDLQPWGALLLRLVLGVAMIHHGFSKVIPAHGFQHTPLSAMDQFSHFVASLGIPPWFGYVSALTEFLGGILLILGLLVRFAAFMITVNLLVAFFAVDLHRGYAASEYVLALIAIAVMLLFNGAGALAVDRRLGLA